MQAPAQVRLGLSPAPRVDSLREISSPYSFPFVSPLPPALCPFRSPRRFRSLLTPRLTRRVRWRPCSPRRASSGSRRRSRWRRESSLLPLLRRGTPSHRSPLTSAILTSLPSATPIHRARMPQPRPPPPPRDASATFAPGASTSAAPTTGGALPEPVRQPYQPQQASMSHKAPPIGYICYRCGQKGTLCSASLRESSLTSWRRSLDPRLPDEQRSSLGRPT